MKVTVNDNEEIFEYEAVKINVGNFYTEIHLKNNEVIRTAPYKLEDKKFISVLIEEDGMNKSNLDQEDLIKTKKAIKEIFEIAVQNQFAIERTLKSSDFVDYIFKIHLKLNETDS